MWHVREGLPIVGCRSNSESVGYFLQESTSSTKCPGCFLGVWDTPHTENGPKNRWKDNVSSQLVPFFRRYLLFVCNRNVGMMLLLGISFHMQLKRFIKINAEAVQPDKKVWNRNSYVWTTPVFFQMVCLCLLVGKHSKRLGSEKNGEKLSVFGWKGRWGGPFFLFTFFRTETR